jgi:YggT family protein
MLVQIVKFLSTILSLYTLLIIIRIIMTWFHGPFGAGKPMAYLAGITDPYLNYFRRFGIFQIGQFDFSPVAALIFLSVVGNILNSVAAFGRVTLGIILALFLGTVWSAAAFFLVLFLILIVVRAVGIIAGINSASPFWRTMDTMVKPILTPLTDLLLGGKTTTYLNGLLIGAAALLLARIAGGFIVRELILLLQKLPF